MENGEHAYIESVLNDYKRDLLAGQDITKLRPEIIEIIRRLNKMIGNGKSYESKFLTQVRDEYQKLIND